MRCDVSWAVIAVIRVAWLYSVGKRFSGRNTAHVEVMKSARPIAGELVADDRGQIVETSVILDDSHKDEAASRESERRLKGKKVKGSAVTAPTAVCSHRIPLWAIGGRVS